MNLTGVVYRPPYEANSLLLQVTLGCSHNKCTFCYMYPDVKFTVCPMEQVEADIDEAVQYCPDVERVFLEHGDAFVLSADRLMQIADAIHRKLPKAETIAMYASIQNIKHKTDAELRRIGFMERECRGNSCFDQRCTAAASFHRHLARPARMQTIW